MNDHSEGILARPAVSWSLVVLATGLGAALRLGGLDSPSLWVDEFFTISRAGTDPLHWSYWLGYQPATLSLWLAGADLGRISLDNIAAWQSLGVTERAARLGPCWVGIASVPLLAVLARVSLGPAVAACAALLLALLPFHIYWSQMSRYYTMEFLFANSFLLLFLRGMQTGRASWFAAAVASGVLAFSSHFTAVFVVGACFGLCAVARLARAPIPHLGRGLAALALCTGLCALGLVLKEIQVPVEKTLSSFSNQAWDPSVRVLVLGAMLRFEPVLCAVGVATIFVALRRKTPLWLLVGGVAVGVPLGVLALKTVFPVGPRYIFAVAFAWILLASAWCAEVDRSLSARAGAIAGATGLIALLVAVGFNTYLYSRDGAGARARWRDAYQQVLREGNPGDPVYAGPGRFQAAYYLEREALAMPALSEAQGLPAGSWIIYRSRGGRRPRFEPPLEVLDHYEIPSKPWSWVLYVVRVPPAERASFSLPAG